jgi:AcrR family transcriptional regulator
MMTDRRSARTRELLQEALFSLLHEVSYDDLSVADITSRANVGRSTFYCHYKDKDDLLASYFVQAMQPFAERLDVFATRQEEVIPISGVCRDLRQCSGLVRSLHGSKRINAMYRCWTRLLADSYTQRLRCVLVQPSTSVSVELLSVLLATQTMAAVRHWIEGGMSMSPEELSRTLHALVRPGLAALTK